MHRMYTPTAVTQGLTQGFRRTTPGVRLALYAMMALAQGGVATGCGGSDNASGALPDTSEHGEFQVAVNPEGGAFHRGANTVDAHAVDPTGQPAQLLTVTAVMPAHNHDAMPPVITPTTDGYRVSDLVLPMPGTWQITLVFATTARHDDVVVTTFVP